MKTSPLILFFKSHIDTFTRKDGTVVNAHEDGRQAAADDHHPIAHMARGLSTKKKTLGDLHEGLGKAKDRTWQLDQETNDPASARAYRQHYTDGKIVHAKLADLDKKYPKLKIMSKIKGDEAMRLISEHATHRHYEPDERSLKNMIEDSK